MKQTIIVVVLCVFVSTVAFSQKNTDGEAVQYIPRAERIDRATLSGAELIADSKVKVSFSALPSSAMCGERCMARAILVVSLGIHGATNRYGHGRASFDASANLTVAGYNNDNLQWTYPTQQSLVIEGTATSTKPVATIVLDVTEYSDLACTAGAATSNDIVVTIDAIDTEGLTAEMVDSLVLTAELIQEYRILPYEGATLNCATDVYVKAPVIADTVHPVKLSWRVADGQTPCPDLYPTFEVEVLRLYNIDPNMRDSETKTRSVVDWRQAQRFLTYGPATSIEFTLAEGTGYYVWRVRPIGNYHPGGIANERNWGCWSMAPAQEAEIRFVGLSDMDIQQTNQYGTNKPFFFYRQFDRDKNWTFKRTFVEDGGGRAGIAEGITYASRLLQPLQVQTPVTTTADVLVQQTVLDYEGRPLVTTLAVPKTRNSAASAVLQYVPNLSIEETNSSARGGRSDHTTGEVNGRRTQFNRDFISPMYVVVLRFSWLPASVGT
ncbi:MAG: hypothetical protein ACK475_08330 [Bacteroidota bacterium]|jgi:hypothetical protein